MDLKFVRLDPTSPRPLPTGTTAGISLLSAIILYVFITFSSSPCLGMAIQDQSGAAVPMPAIAASLSTQPALKLTGEASPSIKPIAKESTAVSPVIVIGFLGGRVRKGNAVHREVQVAAHIRQDYPVGVDAEVFQNAHGERALREILHLLDANHDGTVNQAERKHARIIIYGHSWGASETVTMARQLQSDKIPVLLTILVDRVAKFGAGDPRIPANVAQAVNFYQLNGLLHGRPTIRAVDPASTQIIGNYQLDYKDNHVSCDLYPWYARLFMGPHIEIENDPRVWNQVEALIRAKLPPEKTATTAALTKHAR